MAYQVKENVYSEIVMPLAEACYLAGLFDGEGSLYLVARTGTGRRSHHFHPSMEIGNSNLGLLEAVVGMTGNGRIAVNKVPGSNHKPVYVWQLSVSQIRRVLPQVEPYLLAKRKQAGLMLRYFAIQDRGRMWAGHMTVKEEDIPEVLALYEELRGLNHRGLTEIEPLEFTLRHERAKSDWTCDEPGCEKRRYRSNFYCYDHWLTHREPVLKDCLQCGKQMDCIMPHKRFCSIRCQQRATYERRLAEGKSV